MPKSSQTAKTDFDADRLTEASKRVDTNESFGKTFWEAAKQSKDIDEALKATFLKLVDSDLDTRSALEQLVKSTDKHAFWGAMSKGIMLIVGSVLTGVVTLLVNYLSPK